MDYSVGDVVKLKKPHPCGSSEWEILRTGADFRLKCTGCGRQIMIARKAGGKKYQGPEEKGGRRPSAARWHKLTFRGVYGNIISHDTQKLGKALR